ncbi:MAG: accessory gene regulator B family protein [Lutisporaceae bacterium]
MIDRLSRKITQSLIDKEIISFDDWEVYMYGLQMMISGIVKLIGFMIIAWVLGWIVEAIVFITTFSLLRVNAGGYHADTYLKCFLVTSIATFLSIGIVKYYFVSGSIIYIAIISLLAGALVLFYAPVDTPNKRMVGNEKKIFRRRSIVVLTLEISVIVIAYFISPKISIFCNIAAMAMLFEGITLTPLFAENDIQKERGYYNEE